jgi:hypothetical protein
MIFIQKVKTGISFPVTLGLRLSFPVTLQACAFLDD